MVITAPAQVPKRAADAGLGVLGVVLGSRQDPVVLHGPLDVQGLVDEWVDQFWGVLDGELLGVLVRLVLIDEDHLVDVEVHLIGEEQVDTCLLAMGEQRAFDALPQGVVVDHALTLVGLDRVPGDQGGLLHPDRAQSNALDLDERADVEDGPVGVPVDQVTGLGVERHLLVGRRQPSAPVAGGKPSGPALVTAHPAPPPAVEPAHLPQPGLPLGVDVMALLEDGLQPVTVAGDAGAGLTGDPVGGRTGAPVLLTHLAGVDDVLAPVVVLGLLHHVGLDVSKQHGGSLLGLRERREEAARLRASTCAP